VTREKRALSWGGGEGRVCPNLKGKGVKVVTGGGGRKIRIC